MRQIATLADENAARVLSDYLLTLKIETQLMEEGPGWAVWIRDEDKLPQAKTEVQEFLKNPADARYASAAKTARELRARETEADEAYEKRQIALEKRWVIQTDARPWVTLGLVVASLAVSMAAGTAFVVGQLRQEQLNNRVLQAVLMRSMDDGEVWRLVTPIFLHFGPFHLLFNLLMLRDLGGAVERRRGSLKTLLLVLVLAATSNLGQFYLGPLFEEPSLLFGGMSGVLYGLFGYAWMKSRFAPEMGLVMSPNTVIFLMFWFFLCMTPALGHVANLAHAVGLAMGVLIGIAPHVFNGRRRQGNEP